MPRQPGVCIGKYGPSLLLGTNARRAGEMVSVFLLAIITAFSLLHGAASLSTAELPRHFSLDFLASVATLRAAHTRMRRADRSAPASGCARSYGAKRPGASRPPRAPGNARFSDVTRAREAFR